VSFDGSMYYSESATEKSNVKAEGTRKRARIIDDDDHDSNNSKRRTVDGDNILYLLKWCYFVVVCCYFPLSLPVP
jgi:hypothetical protein